jgi:hypothetical protein
MDPTRNHPKLYQINARVWISRYTEKIGRTATLDDVADAELDALAELGFDWIYLLGVWQNGEASRRIAQSDEQLQKEYVQVLPDLRDADICGSCFAIASYEVNPALGDERALTRLRQRLHSRNMQLMLDFVPNHTAIDHPWAFNQPEYYVPGDETLLVKEPQNYIRLQTIYGERILAHGRDPFFPAWRDTLQLNYGNPEVQSAMIREAQKIAELCDGLRCDMAMLLLPQVFERTWGIKTEPFWPRLIQTLRAQKPDFIFLAEVYWDLERELQQQGFDYTYDKGLYDRLTQQQARPLREHLRAQSSYAARMARFLENHDEPRAASVFPAPVHRAAATAAYTLPGLRFFHDGQLEGYPKRIPMQLCRAPNHPADEELKRFYRQLLRCLDQPALQQGDWILIEPSPAWDGNWTWEDFVISLWITQDDSALLAVVNYASHQSQCYARLAWESLRDHSWRLEDLLSSTHYVRPGSRLISSGLYLDLPPWGAHIFQILPEGKTPREGGVSTL